MSDVQLVAFSSRKGRKSGEYRPLLWPKKSPGRKQGGGSLDKEACMCRLSFRPLLFFVHVDGRDRLLQVNVRLVRRRWFENFAGHSACYRPICNVIMHLQYR